MHIRNLFAKTGNTYPEHKETNYHGTVSITLEVRVGKGFRFLRLDFRSARMRVVGFDPSFFHFSTRAMEGSKLL